MPGHRLNYTVGENIKIKVVVGYMPSAAGLGVSQDHDDPLDGWWWNAETRRPPLGSKLALSIEYHARYPQTLGYLMVVQVLSVPKTDVSILQKNKFLLEQMTEFGDGYAAVDGGRVTPSRLFSGDDGPHATYPFFAYSDAYYKPLKSRKDLMTFRHKDYANAALSHSALTFDCILVAKLKTGLNTFGVLDAFLWGMDLYKEAVLMRRTGISALLTAVLAKEYPDCKFVLMEDPSKIDTGYTPFRKQTLGSKRIGKFNEV